MTNIHASHGASPNPESQNPLLSGEIKLPVFKDRIVTRTLEVNDRTAFFERKQYRV